MGFRPPSAVSPANERESSSNDMSMVSGKNEKNFETAKDSRTAWCVTGR